jgi:hypothetical protein
MKKLFSLFSIALIFSAASFAQAVNPADKIPNLLCHKWEVKSRFVYGQQLSTSAGAGFEFFKDNSFRKVLGKIVEEGTWAYEADKNWVRLKFKKDIPDVFVKSLKEGEFEFIETPEGNRAGMIVLYKIVE